MLQRKTREKHPVSASELAQMGVCERRIVFEHRLGKRNPVSQRAARQRGVIEHARFYEEAVDASHSPWRCEVAPRGGGGGLKDTARRLLRDRGCRLTMRVRGWRGVYGWAASAIRALLVRHAWLQPLARTPFKPVAWLAGYVLRRQRGDHDA